MKNIIITIAALLSLNSCQSQNNIDLLQLKFGEKINQIVENENLEKKTNPVYGILSFRTENLDGLKIGNTSLKTYQYPNAGILNYNRIYLYTDSYDMNRYLGFNYSTVNQEETRSIIDYLKKTYNNIDIRSDKYTEAYFIDIPDQDSWLFIYQYISLDNNRNKFFSTEFVYVKRGTRIENSTDPTYDTFLESFNKICPPKDEQ